MTSARLFMAIAISLLAAAAVSAASEPVVGSRRVSTADINVREKPARDSKLMSTIGANADFEVVEISQDGLWSLIDAPPIVKGWANNAVLEQASRPDVPEPKKTAGTASTNVPSDALSKSIKLLITGISGSGLDSYEELRNGFNVVTEKRSTTYRLVSTDPCVVTVSKVRNIRSIDKNWAIESYSSTYRFDFRKLENLKPSYVEDPSEALMHAFAGGDRNRMLRKPKMTTHADFIGDKAVCMIMDDGSEKYCSTSTNPQKQEYPDANARPKHLRAALEVVKGFCRS